MKEFFSRKETDMRIMVLILLIASLGGFGTYRTYAQEVETEVILVDTSEQLGIEIANLKIDLLLQRAATIQAKANWLDREQRILQRENEIWNSDRAKLILELTEKFKCENTYDLDNRRCLGE